MTSGVVFNGSAFHCSVDTTAGLPDPANRLLSGYCAGRQAVLFACPTIDALYGAALRRYCETALAPGSWS